MAKEDTLEFPGVSDQLPLQITCTLRAGRAVMHLWHR